VNGLAIGSIAAAAVVPIVRNSRRESATARADELAVQARAEMRVAINDALSPLISALAELAAARAAADRKTLTERVLTLGVTVAAGLVDAVRARSTLYQLDPASTGWRLVPTNNAGRSDQARTVFEEGTDAGDAVRAMVDGDEIVYCRDIRQEQPLGWVADPSRSYRTFISVPVTAGDEAFGMLTVNALEPDDLGDEDVSTMRVISAVLGAALALGGPRRKHVGGR
jgi:GAF domain.